MSVDPGALAGTELLELLLGERWFPGVGTPDTVGVTSVPVDRDGLALVVVRVDETDGEGYQLALATAGDRVRDALRIPELVAVLCRLCGVETPGAQIRAMGVEQSNSSVVVDGSHVVKLFRRLEQGVNPEAELLRALGVQSFRSVPSLEGVLEVDGTTLAIVTGFVPSAGDGWSLGLDALRSDPWWLPDRARRLGEVTAGLHAALAADARDPALAPQAPPPGAFARVAEQVVVGLDEVASSVPLATAAGRLARGLGTVDPGGLVARTHGDLHLGQVLWADAGDWVVIDFEGEPGRPLAERRMHRSPVRDVAGMTRSFAYACDGARHLRGVDAPEGWLEACTERFLDGYLAAADARLLPSTRAGFDRLLALFELERIVHELRYELAHRPDWLAIPHAGLERALARGQESSTATPHP